MRKIAKAFLICLLTGSLIAVPLCMTAIADDALKAPSTFNTLIDALVVRPFGLLLIPVGAGAFLISLPFSALGGNTKTSFNQLVVAPTQYTFERPLGDID